MRKNLTRIASLVVAFALLSVPTFAALTGDYDASTGIFTVEGGETGRQTSLIIVEDAHDTLPVADEAVTGAVYIDQLAAAANGAAFEGVSLPANEEVHTAFFSNESENSASSATIVNAEINIAIGSETEAVAATAGDVLVISVNKTRNFTAKVNGAEATLGTNESGDLTYTVPSEAGSYVLTLEAVVGGQTITSNAITITATAAELDPVDVTGVGNILDLVVSPTTEYTAQPVGIRVTFPEAGKTVDKMIWAFETADGIRYSDPVLLSNVATVSGDTVFAAVVKNGTATDGVSNEDAIAITKVGAIFRIGNQDFYTSDAYKQTN